MSAKALLIENPSPTEDEVKEALSGNFCRCISHYHVVKAVLAAAEEGGEDGDPYRFIGKSTIRKDAVDIVTGGARYLNDIKLPGMLYARVLRSPSRPRRIIKRWTRRRRKALPGVKAVLTWEDVPDWKGGTPRVARVLDRKVRFVGDAVAARRRRDARIARGGPAGS